MDIPYCFVRGKAALGSLVHQKNAAVVALTDVRKEVRSIFNVRTKES
jgi:large subunit ribosomal protein L7Ae